jgi:TRAP-type C4-dicarboxylate transport system substrate-binding protein
VFSSAKYMLDAHIVPLVGAVVVTTAAWNQLSAEDKTAVTTAAQDMENRIRAQAPAQDVESIKVMVGRGLVVTTPDAKTMAEFRKAAGDLAVTMRGGIVPEAIYDMAAQERDAVRKKK